jgi:hypothetical protein
MGEIFDRIETNRFDTASLCRSGATRIPVFVGSSREVITGLRKWSRNLIGFVSRRSGQTHHLAPWWVPSWQDLECHTILITQRIWTESSRSKLAPEGLKGR